MIDLEPEVIRNLIFLFITLILPFLIGKGASKKNKKRDRYSQDIEDTEDTEYIGYSEYSEETNDYNFEDEPVQQQTEIIRRQPIEKKIIFQTVQPLPHGSDSLETKKKRKLSSNVERASLSQMHVSSKDNNKRNKRKKLKKHFINGSNITSAITHKEILEPKYF